MGCNTSRGKIASASIVVCFMLISIMLVVGPCDSRSFHLVFNEAFRKVKEGKKSIKMCRN